MSIQEIMKNSDYSKHIFFPNDFPLFSKMLEEDGLIDTFLNNPLYMMDLEIEIYTMSFIDCLALKFITTQMECGRFYTHIYTQAGVSPPEKVKKETYKMMDEKIRVFPMFV